MKRLLMSLLLAAAVLSGCGSKLLRTDCELVPVLGMRANPNNPDSPRLPVMDNRGIPLRRLVCAEERQKEAAEAAKLAEAEAERLRTARQSNGVFFAREVMAPNVFDLEQTQNSARYYKKTWSGDYQMYQAMLDNWRRLDIGESLFVESYKSLWLGVGGRTLYGLEQLNKVLREKYPGSTFSYASGSGTIRDGLAEGSYQDYRLVRFKDVSNSLIYEWDLTGAKTKPPGITRLKNPVYVSLRISDSVGQRYVVIAYENPDNIRVIDAALQTTAKNETSRLERGVGVNYDNNAMVQVLNALYEEKYRHNEAAYRRETPNGLISIAEKLLLDPDYRNQLIGLTRAKGDKK